MSAWDESVMNAAGMTSLDVIVQLCLVLVPMALVFTLVWVVMAMSHASAGEALTEFEHALDAAIAEESEVY